MKRHQGQSDFQRGDILSDKEDDPKVDIHVDPAMDPDKADFMEMKREVGLLDGISFIVGTIVGSGIFVSPQGVLRATGSVGLSLTVWAGTGLVSLLGSLCYCELGTLLPKAGGEYAYIKSAFGDMPGFLFIWVTTIVVRPASNAIKALTLATYFTSLFQYCGSPELPTRLTAVASLVTIMLLNSYSVTLASKLQVFTTATKVLALGIISVGGIYKITQGYTQELESGFEGSTTDPSVIALAFYDASYAYSGWNSLNFITEEIKKPHKNLPRAIIISMGLVIVIYLLTNISYLSVISKTELLEADAVAMLWGDRVLMSVSIIIPLSVIMSTLGSTNGSIFAAGRVSFSGARDGNLPEILGFINVSRLTPLPSIIFSSLCAIIFVMVGNISTLIHFLSFTIWIFHGLTFAALLYFRVKRKNAVRPYKVPVLIPIIMVLVSIFLVVAPVVRSPDIEFLYAVVFIIGGAIVHVLFIRFKLKFPGFDALTMYAQLLLESAPPRQFMD